MIEITKNKEDTLQCSADEDVSEWFIRASIIQKDKKITKKSATLKGGSHHQIYVDLRNPTIFYVNLEKSDTSTFEDHQATFELELESPDYETLSIRQDKIMFT